mgnify:FL=1
MNREWLILFVVSLALLIIILVRTRIDIRMFGFALLHLVVASVALFVINESEWFGDFYIPINAYTVFAVGIFGIPGLLLLAGIKLTLM